LLTIQRDSPEQIYHQLYRQLRAEIETGVRQPGQRLASTRFLAQQLKLSRNTVDHAYQDLVAEGYLISQPGAGYRVSHQLPYLTGRPLTDQIPKISPAFKVDFTESYDNLRLFPKQAWRAAEQTVMFQGLPHIQPANGDLAYRQQLTHFLARLKGLNVSAAQIIITSGFNEAAGIIANLVPALKTDKLAVQNPIAPNARTVWQRLQVPTIPFTPTTEQPVAGGYLLAPTHNFPTGSGLNQAERQAFASWARRHQRYVIELDTDATLDYSGQPQPALFNDLADHGFYYSNYDDTLGAALCMGFLVIPSHLVADYQAKYGRLPNRNSQWQQQILGHLIASGDLERFMRQLTIVYRNRRQHLISKVDDVFGPTLTPMGTTAGTFIPFQLTPAPTTSVIALIAQATQAGIGIVNPDRCWLNQLEPFPSIVLSFRQVDDNQIDSGIDQLYRCWQP